MFNRVWQSGLSALARVDRVRRFVQERNLLQGLAAQYVAAASPADAAAYAREVLRRQKLRSTLSYLGEPAVEPAQVARNLVNYQAAVEALGRSSLEVLVCVDPAQVGAAVDVRLAVRNLQRIGQAVVKASAGRPGRHALALDLVEPDMATANAVLADELLKADVPVVQTVQARLLEAPAELARRIIQGVPVRLVRGAVPAGAEVAHLDDAAIDASYRRLLDTMFSAKARSHRFHPIVATHDARLQRYALDLARRNQWRPGEYEFELPLGVGVDTLEMLRARGERVRLLLPFGTEWWSYALHRISENPHALKRAFA